MGENVTFSEIKAIACTAVSMKCIPPASPDCEREGKEESVDIMCIMDKKEILVNC